MGLALAEDTIPTPALSLRRCRTCTEEYPRDYVVCPRDSTPLGVDLDSEDPLLGTVLAGSFRIVRTLGRGGMGKLYEAQHTRLDRRFAIKVLHDAQSRSADSRRRFEREARALSRIRSDHVLDVMDVLSTADGRAAIVTARLDGEDLKARLDRVKKLPVEEALPIARQVCRGLAAAHAEGIVHRDMKPSNLFLESGADGRVSVKILDFGVAKLLGEPELTRTGAVVGTPAYMAPEQARGSAKVDARADVYAVGAVLYRMLTGRPPYVGDEPAQLLSSLLHETPTRPRQLAPSIPIGLEAVIQRAMSRDPSDRPADALTLERELAGFDPGGDEAESASTTWEPESGGGDRATLILPRGSVSRASAIAKRARRARPLAVLLSASVAAACGACAALAAAGLWTLSGEEEPLARSLAWLAAGAATLGSLAAIGRAGAARWDSAPEVLRFDRVLLWALVAGLGAEGVIALVGGALGALEGAAVLGSGGGLLARGLGPIAAGLVGGALGWRRRD